MVQLAEITLAPCVPSPGVYLGMYVHSPQGFEDVEMPYSTPNSEWNVIDTFVSGQVIEIDVVIVYYHWVRRSVRRPVNRWHMGCFCYSPEVCQLEQQGGRGSRYRRCTWTQLSPRNLHLFSPLPSEK